MTAIRVEKELTVTVHIDGEPITLVKADAVFLRNALDRMLDDRAVVQVEEGQILVITAPNGRRLQWNYATEVSPSVWNSIGELPARRPDPQPRDGRNCGPGRHERDQFCSEQNRICCEGDMMGGDLCKDCPRRQVPLLDRARQASQMEQAQQGRVR